MTLLIAFPFAMLAKKDRRARAGRRAVAEW